MSIVGFIELLQFGVLVAVTVLFLLAVSLCLVLVWQYVREKE